MKDFHAWLKSENLSNFMPNMGQRAVPIQQPQTQPQQPRPQQPQQTQQVQQSQQAQQPQQPQQAQQPKQIRLSDFADQVQDLDWHSLYDVFTRQYRMAPQDPKVAELGKALYNSAQTKDFRQLQPYKQQHLQAQRYQ